MPITAVRRAAALLVFCLAFVINPLYVAGCMGGTDEEDAARAAAAKEQLVATLDELNGTASWPFEMGGVEYELLLELSQAGRPASAVAPTRERFVQTAHACGQHTFYQSASACDTQYQLAVAGTFTLRRLGSPAETVAADVAVSGMLEQYGALALQLAHGGQLVIYREGEADYELTRFVATDLGAEALDVSFEAPRSP